jgi:alkylation response protein AidB-like acyl-CoA dehydrogenase
MSTVIDIHEIRSLARQFAADQLRPHTEEWDRDGVMDDTVLTQLGEMGFVGMAMPESVGGMGLGLEAAAAALEELAWGEAAVAVSVAQTGRVANLLLGAGAGPQHREWAGRLATAEVWGCLAMAEDDDGVDVGGMGTRAVRAGAGFRIRGEKRWITNPSRSAVAVVVAGTEEGPTLFVVPTTTAGWVRGARDATMGLRPLEVATVRLEDVEVGEDAVLGGMGGALELLESVAPAHRVAIAAIAAGIARAALEHARAYADEREQFGAPIRSFEGIQFKLADMATRTEAALRMAAHAAASPTPAAAAMAKLFASEAAMWVTTQAVQIFGGYGYMRDYPVEKLMRDAKATELVAGTSDLLRARIAEELYRH